jgi:hypothetical protein
MRQRNPNPTLTDAGLARELGLTRVQWGSIKMAATDASLPTRDYCRLMLLCAAGHGGVVEHAERAIAADLEAYAETK